MSADKATSRKDARARAIERFAATRHAAQDFPALDEKSAGELGEVADYWRSLDALADDPAVLALRAAARARLASTNRSSRLRRPAIAALAASIVCAVGLLGTYRLRPPPPAQTPLPSIQLLANAKGAPRTFQLPDGSRVTLDTQTTLRLVGWAQHGRRVLLDRGRAYFEVAHDNARPFQVDAGGVRTTDLGTRFAVEALPDGATIALLEGAVSVHVPRGNGSFVDIPLRPGARLTSRAGAWRVLNDARQQAEWQTGMLSFDDQPLAVVVGSLNRYLDHPLVLSGDAERKFRVSGVFRIGDPRALPDTLSAMGKANLLEPSPVAAQVR